LPSIASSSATYTYAIAARSSESQLAESHLPPPIESSSSIVIVIVVAVITPNPYRLLIDCCFLLVVTRHHCSQMSSSLPTPLQSNTIFSALFPHHLAAPSLMSIANTAIIDTHAKNLMLTVASCHHCC
jgi:hypothetical protein